MTSHETEVTEQERQAEAIACLRAAIISSLNADGAPIPDADMIYCGVRYIADIAKQLAEAKAQAAAFADATPLTPEAVMELLPANYGIGTKGESGQYASPILEVSWYRDSITGDGLTLYLENTPIDLQHFTVGRFRMLLTDLAITPEHK